MLEGLGNFPSIFDPTYIAGLQGPERKAYLVQTINTGHATIKALRAVFDAVTRVTDAAAFQMRLDTHAAGASKGRAAKTWLPDNIKAALADSTTVHSAVDVLNEYDPDAIIAWMEVWATKEMDAFCASPETTALAGKGLLKTYAQFFGDDPSQPGSYASSKSVVPARVAWWGS